MSAPIVFTDPVPEFDPGGAVPPGYQVPRQTGNGVQMVTPQPMFTGPPVDMVPQVIRREDFPPGPEGDEMYAQALQALMNQPARIVTGFDEAGNPIYGQVPGGVLPNGRSGSEQAAGNFQRSADIFNYHGGLNVQNRAQIRPGEAQMALFANQAAAANGGQGRPDLLLDDATVRNIVTGLGGPQAMQGVADQVRQDLINAGIIPDPSAPMSIDPSPNNPDFGGPGQVGETVRIGDVTYTNMGNGLWIGSDGGNYVRDEAGNFQMPGYKNDPAANERAMQDMMPPAPGQVDRSGAVPTPMVMPPPPDRSGAVPVPVQQNPDRSGAVPIGLQERPEQYQYTREGQDVFLDVKVGDQTHRFTGDVVQAAYTSLGFGSFDEMVLALGYKNAVSALFDFISPPPPVNAPPGAPPQQAPSHQPPPPPSNPSQGTTGQPGGKGPSFF